VENLLKGLSYIEKEGTSKEDWNFWLVNQLDRELSTFKTVA